MPEVKHEDGVDEDNHPDKAEQGAVEITPMLLPEVDAIEMVGVEEGGDDDDDDAVDNSQRGRPCS